MSEQIAMKVLVIDAGDAHVQILISGEGEPRKFKSGEKSRGVLWKSYVGSYLRLDLDNYRGWAAQNVEVKRSSRLPMANNRNALRGDFGCCTSRNLTPKE